MDFFPEPLNRELVAKFLGAALDRLSDLTLYRFYTGEARELRSLIHVNLEFIIYYEQFALTVLLPKGADVDGYFVWDNIRYMSRRLLEVQGWKQFPDDELAVFVRQMLFR